MADNSQELVTIACSHCGQHNFTFSKNAISPKNGISFTCSQCGYTTFITLDKTGSIAVECV